jgi:hypothetical protein
MRAELRRVKLTDRLVKSATTGGRKSPIFMDDEVIGFGVQVRQTGRKSFTLDYMLEGQRRRLYIGDFPDWRTHAARVHGKLIKREVDQALDPLALRNERRTAPTVKDLIERYLTEHVTRLAPDNASDYRSMMMTYVVPAWGERKVIDIRRSDVDELLVQIAKERARSHKKKSKQKRLKPLQPPRLTPGRANRVGCASRSGRTEHHVDADGIERKYNSTGGSSLQDAGVKERVDVAMHGLNVAVQPPCRLADRHRSCARHGADQLPPLRRQQSEK